MAPDCSSSPYPTSLCMYYTPMYQSTGCYEKIKIVETKQQRIDRIATEKMLASWKTYNEKTRNVKEIKQICKPRHRVRFQGRRF